MIEAIDSPHILEATSENFTSLVLENSKAGPVLVNFWSRKAGPCLRQYPILDKLIHHYGGRLLLVNVDTESEFVFTKEYSIASVPTLKLFRYGQVVETLHGYQSEKDLSKILDQYVSRDSDKLLSKAIQEYAQGNASKAYEILAQAIVSDPINPRLPLAMCKLLKHEQRYDEALKLIESMPPDIRKNAELVQQHALLSFYVDLPENSSLEILYANIESAPEDLQARRQLVAHYVVEEKYEQALQELVKIMEIDQGYDNNYARIAMLNTFHILGNAQELVAKYRPNLKRYTH